MKRIAAILLLFVLAGVTACAAPENAAGTRETAPAAETRTAEAVGTVAGTETAEETTTEKETTMTHETMCARLLYQGHGSVRITTPEGKTVYVDPYAGDGYDVPADLILITHAHSDHTAVELIRKRATGCRLITWEDALADGKHQTFDLGYLTVEAVEAGNNKNHDLKSCVGYVLTLSDGVTVYLSGDTSKTEEMTRLAEKKIDYAFFCCDGIYNMGLAEAAECARLVGAKHNVPYHMAPGQLFDRAKAEAFDAPNKLIVADGEEITLTK